MFLYYLIIYLKNWQNALLAGIILFQTLWIKFNSYCLLQTKKHEITYLSLSNDQ